MEKQDWVNPYTHSANSADPDQTPQNLASDQDLNCLLTEHYIEFLFEMRNATQQPLKQKSAGPTNIIRVEKSFRLSVIKMCFYLWK